MYTGESTNNHRIFGFYSFFISLCFFLTYKNYIKFIYTQQLKNSSELTIKVYLKNKKKWNVISP